LEKIPVIIINWNGIEDTVECIESVLNQSNQNFIVYVVDNGSDNDEFEMLKEKYGGNSMIVLQRNEINIGFTEAHNQLFNQLKNSDAEFVALLNNDAIADYRWLETLLSIAEKEKADMVGSLMLNYYNRTVVDSAGLFLLSSGEILPIGHGVEVDSLPTNRGLVAASGGACLYRFSMLNEIGVFDSYFSTGYEDAELGLRALVSGKKIVFARNAIVYHKMSRSVSKIFNRKKAQKIQEDINYTYLKLLPAGTIVINSLTNFPRWILIMLIHIITLRYRFIIVQVGALSKTVFELKRIVSRRKEFRKYRRTDSLKIMKVQTFFLSYDIKRFIKLVVKVRKNQFERY
jgi:GT2 family glycosyltransferase